MGIGSTIRNFFIKFKDEEDEDEIIEVTTAEEVQEQEAPRPRQKVRERDMHNTNTGKPEFVVVKPEKFDESIEIGSYLLERKTVVLNLESTGKD